MHSESRRNYRSTAASYFRKFVSATQAFYFNIKNYKKIFKVKDGNYLWIEEWKPRKRNIGQDTRVGYRIKRIVWVDWFSSPYIECETRPETFVRLEDLEEFTIFSTNGPKYKKGDYLYYNGTKYLIDNIVPYVVYYDDGHYTPKLSFRYFGRHLKDNYCLSYLFGPGEDFVSACPPITRTWNELNNV